MNNKAGHWIIAALALLLIVGTFISVKFFINSTTPTQPGNTAINIHTPTTSVPSSGGNSQVSQNNPVALPSQYGGTIQVKNFKIDPAVVKDPANPGYYYLGYHYSGGVSDPTATSTPPYVVEYIDSTHYFSIALLQKPLGQVRQQMEQYLMADLGISKNQMCQLKYMVSAPVSVDRDLAGVSLGFSFCPGAVQLP